jgi:hypothetical protein
MEHIQCEPPTGRRVRLVPTYRRHTMPRCATEQQRSVSWTGHCLIMIIYSLQPDGYMRTILFNIHLCERTASIRCVPTLRMVQSVTQYTHSTHAFFISQRDMVSRHSLRVYVTALTRVTDVQLSQRQFSRSSQILKTLCADLISKFFTQIEQKVRKMWPKFITPPPPQKKKARLKGGFI